MKLTILATSDIHGYIGPTNFSSKRQDMPYGAVKAATVLKKEKEQATGPVVTIENGDFIQGSPLSYYIARRRKSTNPEDLVTVLNMMEYDVGVIGNHEFNYGEDYLKQAISAMNYPVLVANILNEAGEPAFGQAYEIVEKEGLKIAVLGLTTTYIPNWEHPDHIKGMTFKDGVETAKELVPQLRELADVVVVSYHGGFERDLKTGEITEPLTGENEAYQLMTEVPGIDALITGHQHRLIATKINNIPVIQPGYRGEAVGKITLTIEKNDNGAYVVTQSEASLIETATAIPDAAIATKLADLFKEVDEWLDQPLGRVEGDMRIQDAHRVRAVEHPYVELIHKVQMEATGTDISGTALFVNEGKGFGEIITMRDVVTNYVYPNTLAVLRVSGADLKAALEHSATYFKAEKDGSVGINPDFIHPKPQYYNYDMYEGIDYTINAKKPFGERIVQLEYHGKTIQPEDQLDITLNQYRAVGGGNYPMYSADKIIRENQKDMSELIADYLVEHPVIKAETNNNFKVVAE
ncbi:bifunctional metallophosphatase/5'-nucleotidase [Carnobacterium funditum]|uniref:bifunctional metallophosphatase/5'-nucleotidase n=1 Tax=Carnobacterium funditum TaxID=2752 RepID=UPI00054F470E|nr:bifunctional metallophosphatase/5'-nucleotidase [Carnobacterium funditum]